jgi:hypothetical protein
LFKVLSYRHLSKNLNIKIYKTVTLLVVLYRLETRYFTLREEHRLRMFENRVLKRIFCPKREEVAGGWRILHNEELHNLYTSPNIISVINSRMMGWAEHVGCIEEMRNAYKILVGKPEEKRPLGRPTCGWEFNIRIDVRKQSGKVWTGFIWLRTRTSGNETPGSMGGGGENFLTS